MKIPDWIEKKERAVCIRVRVVPGKKCSCIVAMRPSSIVIHIHGKPKQGEANEALLEYLSNLFQNDRVQIIKGHRSQSKCVLIPDVSPEYIAEKIYENYKEPL
jgi:uncharacterized protein (TIGR00251 family)